jgi:hypothetical protein
MRLSIVAMIYAGSGGKEMMKRKPKYIQEIKKQIAADARKRRTAFRKEQFQEALSKDKVETIGDVWGIYCGLSARAKENAVYHQILFLARCGKTAREIVSQMEVKQ